VGRDPKRESEGAKEVGEKRERERVCVCVCVMCMDVSGKSGVTWSSGTQERDDMGQI